MSRIPRLSILYRKRPTILDSARAKKRKSIEEICQYYHIDEPLAWAVVLEGKSDLERFMIFGRSEYSDDTPRYFNFWNFSLIDKRLGLEYPGRLAAQVMLNLLYYYTNQARAAETANHSHGSEAHTPKTRKSSC